MKGIDLLTTKTFQLPCNALAVLMTVVLVGGLLPAAQAVELQKLTLTGPDQAILGKPTSFSGRLTAPSGIAAATRSRRQSERIRRRPRLAGVPEQRVVIRVDGQTVASTKTASDGTYAVSLTFNSYGSFSIHAVANPDSQLATGSAPITVKVVPPYDDTVVSDIAEVTEFLFSGPDPIQTGVAPNTIEPERAGVVRGTVTDVAGTTLDDVTITIPDHPELGQTQTRTNGVFDMAVNGGGTLTLRYEKPGFIPVERQSPVSWGQYDVVPEVVMTRYDTKATTINLIDPSDMQVAQATPVTDASGTRTATVLVPEETIATMHLPDGTEEPLPSMTLRATELTAGQRGPDAMPGELPASSGYTYAVELSIDQAVQAGATEVSFTQALPTYTENFLGFPVGMAVPAAYYDYERHEWIPQPNGRVVKIVGSSAGEAELDTDGDGNVDAPAALSGLGVTTDELEELARLYTVGQSLWRVPVTHFSPWDYNWPYGPPGDARYPGQRDATGGESDGCFEQRGSIIGCENQTLGETVPIAGTPFELRYDSSRVVGRKPSLPIPLSGSTIPASLKRITLDIEIAGRRFSSSFEPATNLSHNFIWDGRDAYGRVLTGEQNVTITIGYVYDGVYYAPRDFAASFGQVGSGPIAGNRTRREITLSQSYETRLGTVSGAALQSIGGWTLSAHHSYDTRGGVLHLGDGGRLSADTLNPSFVTSAGNGNTGPFGQGTYTGDGGAATEAGLSDLKGIATGPDGSLFIADTRNGVVRRVSAAGTITTFAGGGLPPTGNGDGGPATQAELINPADVEVGSDSSVYILDAGAVRRVGPDGIITTFAGGGFPSDGIGDNGPATGASFDRAKGIGLGSTGELYVADTFHDRVRRIDPSGFVTTVAGGGTPTSGIGDGGQATDASLHHPWDVAVAPDGSLYIADTDNDRIRKVTPDGIITTVAGTGIAGDLGDGGPATAAYLAFPTGITYDRSSSSVVFADRLNHSVRQIAPDGTITTVAGSRTDGFSGENGPPGAAKLAHPHDVAIAPDGKLYVADTNNFRVRRITPALPGFGASDFIVPSPKGLYQFNVKGRHLRTLDPLTGAVLYRFGYDTAGRLVSVEDDFGNVTAITFDAAGKPVSIVSPFGVTTELSVNPDGYLSRIENAAGEAVTMTYGSGGLLQTFTTASGSSNFTYDDSGRLSRDEGPAGFSITLARSETPRGYRVTSTTAEGHATVYEVEKLASGAQRRAILDSSGALSEGLSFADGTTRLVGPDGTVTKTVVQPEPRWGMASPIASSVTVTLPSGKTSTVDVARTTTLTDPSNIFSVGSQTDTITSQGRTYTKTYNAATDTITVTTPGGRQDVTVLNADDLVASTQHGDQATTTFGYDTRGRLATVTEGSGAGARTSSIGYGASGFVTSLTDPLHTTTFTNDAIGRVLTITLPDDEVISYGYEGSGSLDTLTPPDRGPHSFDYTSGNQRSRYTPPSAGAFDPATTYAYDSDRRPTTISLPGGASISLSYDTAGRLGTQSYSSGTITYGYDPATSQLVSIDAPSGANLDYSYDGSLLTTVQSAGPSPGTVTYGYDTDLKVSSRKINSATPTTYSYDDDGLLTAAGPLRLTWDPTNGNLATTTLGAVTTSHTYNSFGEPESTDATASAVTLYDVTYTRDDLGRIATKTETIQGVTKLYAYTYDSRGRLTDVTTDGIATEHYDYDGNGNRTAATVAGDRVTATYDAQDRLITYGDATYSYNPRGQLTEVTEAGATTTFDYDELGNLLQVVLPSGQTITYKVDGLGRRISRTADGTVTNRYLYGTGLLPVAELDAAGNVVATFTYATRSHVPDTITKAGVEYRLVTDHLGSVRLVVNSATGAVAQRIDYDTYGNVTQDTNPGFQPFGYAGALYDAATGLVRFGARDYYPKIGRWTTKDPIDFAGGDTNLYAYVGGDPINYFDSEGFEQQAATGSGMSAMCAGYAANGGFIERYVCTTGMKNVPESNPCPAPSPVPSPSPQVPPYPIYGTYSNCSEPVAEVVGYLSIFSLVGMASTAAQRGLRWILEPRHQFINRAVKKMGGRILGMGFLGVPASLIDMRCRFGGQTWGPQDWTGPGH